MKVKRWILVTCILLSACGKATPPPATAPTATAVPTSTRANTVTTTPTKTPRPTITPTATSTNTPRPTSTLTPTDTPIPTSTPTATATDTPVPTDTPIPTNTTAPTNTPPPADTPEPPPPPAAQVVISFIFFDGLVSRVEADEYAEITNNGGAAINLAGWRLNAGDDGQDFYFPDFTLQPGQTCRVYTNQDHPNHCGFSYNSGRALWNNKGECGFLYDGSGAEVAKRCY